MLMCRITTLFVYTITMLWTWASYAPCAASQSPVPLRKEYSQYFCVVNLKLFDLDLFTYLLFIILIVIIFIFFWAYFTPDVRYIEFNTSLNLLSKKIPNGNILIYKLPLLELIQVGIIVITPDILPIFLYQNLVWKDILDIAYTTAPYGFIIMNTMNYFLYNFCVILISLFMCIMPTINCKLDALWYFALIILLSADVHKNPGPLPTEYENGFFLFFKLEFKYSEQGKFL